MQTIKLKSDILSYVTGLDDKKLIQELYQWVMSKEKVTASTHSIAFTPPKRKGSLTEGYGIWSDDVWNNEQDYRKNIWQTERNVW